MVWRGHCAPGLLRYLKFGPNVPNFELFRIHLTSKRDDWVGHKAWPNAYNHPPHGYATWSLVWCFCAEVLRHFKLATLAEIPKMGNWFDSHTRNLEIKKIKVTFISYPGYALLIDTMVFCSAMLPRAPEPQIRFFSHSVWSHPSEQHTTDRMRHACIVLSAWYQLILLSQSLIDSLWSWSWGSVGDVHKTWSYCVQSRPT